MEYLLEGNQTGILRGGFNVEKFANWNQIENKLWELQIACNRYKEIDCLADWVLFAIDRHIMTNRSTKQFEYDFVSYPSNKLEYLIRQCLNGDRSHDGIIKTVKKIIST